MLTSEMLLILHWVFFIFGVIPVALLILGAGFAIVLTIIVALLDAFGG